MLSPPAFSCRVIVSAWFTFLTAVLAIFGFLRR
jgi:hypothetical protein